MHSLFTLWILLPSSLLQQTRILASWELGLFCLICAITMAFSRILKIVSFNYLTDLKFDFNNLSLLRCTLPFLKMALSSPIYFPLATSNPFRKKRWRRNYKQTRGSCVELNSMYLPREIMWWIMIRFKVKSLSKLKDFKVKVILTLMYQYVHITDWQWKRLKTGSVFKCSFPSECGSRFLA